MSRASSHALKHPPVTAPSETAGATPFPELAVAIERERRRGRGAQSNESGRFEAEARVAAGATWIDVRYTSEYQYNRLPGALNVPLAEIRNAIGVLDRNREYVVYCQSGRRSSAAAFLLSQHGYTAAWLEGGLQRRATDS